MKPQVVAALTASFNYPESNQLDLLELYHAMSTNLSSVFRPCSYGAKAGYGPGLDRDKSGPIADGARRAFRSNLKTANNIATGDSRPSK